MTRGGPVLRGRSRDVRFAAADGWELAGTAFEPVGAARGVVVINSATAVKRRYYERFAMFLMGAGFGVLTYDYRGIGGSSPAPLRSLRVTMRQWGELDQPAALAFARRWLPEPPLMVVGHSVGGQIFGLLEDPGAVSRVLTIAAQHNYWRLWDAPDRQVLWALWHVVLPVSTHAVGYFPGSRLGLGEDLPRGVALEWARWCRSPGALVEAVGGDAADRFARYDGPLVAVSIDDDRRFAPERAVDRLAGLYRSARITRAHVAPADVGLTRIGHFGFFRESAGARLWPLALEWLGTGGGTSVPV